MSLTGTKKRTMQGKVPMVLAIVVALCIASFVTLNTAQGSDPVSTDTIGLGAEQSTKAAESQELPSSKMETGAQAVSDVSSTAETLQQMSQRTITVKDPDPVVEVAGVDTSNPEAVAAAEKIGETNPLPTAPRIAPDTSGPGWQTGMASAYDLETNQGWDATAIGITLTRDSMTVAVPESQDHLLGRLVEIVYDDKVVVATITDTGGFEKYGRALDLAGGVWKAFGVSSWEDWGVREVKYKFL